MSTTAQILSHQSLVVILATAPTGLGHLRVTKALYEGLPKAVSPLLLGSHDPKVASLHRLSSIHLLTRTLVEHAQRGALEDVFTATLRTILRNHTDRIYRQIETILEQRLTVPTTVLLISTHSSLAHQLGAIKKKLSQEKKVTVFLVVCVTDDTPQHIWYIPETDLTFVPSDRTKEYLQRYGRISRLNHVFFKVISYPVSPALTQRLTSSFLKSRRQQTDSKSRVRLHLSLPISGAAVGTTYFQEIIETLSQQNSRFFFHVVSKIAPYTEAFIQSLIGLNYVKLYISSHDREVVDMYESVYQKNPISLEITKPSEQAFKALLKPTQVGGSILLFSTPIGQQEYDNLYFLRRHNLIPLLSEQALLFEYAKENKSLQNSEAGKLLFDEAKHWRGLRVSDDVKEASQFILWCLDNGLFTQMLAWQVTTRNVDQHSHELGSDGVQQFWRVVAKLISDRK